MNLRIQVIYLALLVLISCFHTTAQNTITSIITSTEAGKTITSIVTPTDSFTTSSSPSTTPNGNQSNSNDGSNKTVVAAGVSVGVVVVLSAVGIFIFRKWKLRPTRKFEDKLQANNHFRPIQHNNSRDDTVFLRELNE